MIELVNFLAELQKDLHILTYLKECQSGHKFARFFVVKFKSNIDSFQINNP